MAFLRLSPYFQLAETYIHLIHHPNKSSMLDKEEEMKTIETIEDNFSLSRTPWSRASKELECSYLSIN